MPGANHICRRERPCNAALGCPLEFRSYTPLHQKNANYCPAGMLKKGAGFWTSKWGPPIVILSCREPFFGPHFLGRPQFLHEIGASDAQNCGRFFHGKLKFSRSGHIVYFVFCAWKASSHQPARKAPSSHCGASQFAHPRRGHKTAPHLNCETSQHSRKTSCLLRLTDN